jgi:hypothetical protein
MENDIKLKKEWFIEQGTGKIEDNYEIDERMVPFNNFWSKKLIRNLDLGRTAGSSRPKISTQRPAAL